MTIAQLLVWSNVIPGLISAGIAVEGQIAALIKSFHATMTDAEINGVVALIMAGAAQGKAIAVKDAGGA